MADINILFVIFNRPETTRKVFDSIRAAKPTRLFIAADGPRKESEVALCEETRKIAEAVDWPCEVKTLFQPQNLGCKRGVYTAISWFFEHVEWGVIVEDDCVPDISFFHFCEKMLKKYADDDRVMMVSGTNYMVEQHSCKTDYYYSNLQPIWGWASWRRAWQQMDLGMTKLEELIEDQVFFRLFGSQPYALKIQDSMLYHKRTNYNTWDIPWACSIIANHGLCIVPKYNLVSNIGAGGQVASTHPSEITDFNFMPVKNFQKTEYISPDNILPSYGLDYEICTKIMNIEGTRRYRWRYFKHLVKRVLPIKR